VHLVPSYAVSLTHRPTRDGQPVRGNHVPYYLALEMVSEAWGRAIVDFCGAALSPMDLAVVGVTSDFWRELFVGDAEVDVALDRIGTSSVTFRCRLSQDGEQAATVTAVLCRVNAGRTKSVPLSEAQRTALEPLLVVPAVD
jgi:acyl-CoA thioesterase FadM